MFSVDKFIQVDFNLKFVSAGCLLIDLFGQRVSYDFSLKRIWSKVHECLAKLVLFFEFTCILLVFCSLENNPCSSSNTIFDNFKTQPFQREININDSDWSPPERGLYNRRKYTKKELREDLAGISKTVDKPYPNNPYIAFEAQKERENTMATDGNSSELDNTSSESAINSPVIAKKSRRVLNCSQLDND